MKRTYQLLFVTVCALLLVVACRKVNNKRQPDQNTFTPNTGGPPSIPSSTVSLNELFKEFRSTPEKQCVTAGVQQTIAFAKGTRLTFYPNSFKDAAGKIITSGTICIEMIEMYKAGDMIANVATTITADGNLLISGGEVYINATKNGQKVYANKYRIAFKQTGPSTERMAIYYANRNNKDSLTAWTIADTLSPGRSSGTIFDSLPTPPPPPPLPPPPPPPFSYYVIFDSCTDFNFVNCDRFYGIGPITVKAHLNVTMPDTSYNSRNTVVYIILPEINGVIKAYSKYGDLTFKTDGGVPTGMAIGFIVMTRKNDTYYYFEQTGLTATDGMTVNVAMTIQSMDYIKTKLGAL